MGSLFRSSSGVWYLKPPGAALHGRSIRLAARTRAEAEAESLHYAGLVAPSSSREESLRALVALGEWAKAQLGAEASRGTPFEAVWAAYSRRAMSPGTLRARRGAWRRWTEWAAAHGVADSGAVTRAVAQAYATDTSLAAALSLASVFSGAGLDASAWRGLDGGSATAGRARRLLPSEAREVLRRLERCDRAAGRVGWGLADVLLIGWHTGLRVADILSLRVDAWDRDGQCIRTMPQKTSRRKPRGVVIPVPRGGELEAALDRLAARGEEYFLPGALRLGRPGAWTASRYVYEVAGEAFGWVRCQPGERARWHSTRASFVSMMDEAGVPAAVTDAITGHAPDTMHGHYSQPGIDAMLDAVRRAIPALRGAST